jgi:hypothetical protein
LHLHWKIANTGIHPRPHPLPQTDQRIIRQRIEEDVFNILLRFVSQGSFLLPEIVETAIASSAI